jgi:hypothetical protein
MSDPFYPTVDIDFLLPFLKRSEIVDQSSIVQVGNTTSFALTGRQALHKRLFVIRELKAGQIGVEQATAIAYRLGFLGELSQWLEDRRNRKDGGYKI